MEEYDYDLHYHVVKFPDGSAEISSNIDDNIDYLEPFDRICIIIKLLNELFEQFYSDIVGLPQDSEVVFEKFADGEMLRDNLIDVLINACQNHFANAINIPKEKLSFSLIMFAKEIAKDKKQITTDVYDTAYSMDLGIVDPLLACNALTIDCVSTLLEDGVSDEDIEDLIKYHLDAQYKAVKKYIQERNENKN